MQYGFYIESNFCTGCKACQVACKDEHDLEVGQLFRQVYTFEGGYFKKDGDTYTNNIYAFNLSLACHHCDNPECVNNCPTGAMNKDPETGIVSVNQDRCIGCRYCTWNCPYGAPQYNELIGKTGKCDLCQDRIASGENPVCVDACPLRAIHFGDIDELRAEYGDVGIELIGDEKNTSPNIVIKPHPNANI